MNTLISAKNVSRWTGYPRAVIRWTLLLVTACGRLGFDALDGSPGGDAADAPSGGDSMVMIDGPPTGSMTWTFGEPPTSMIQSVTRDSSGWWTPARTTGWS